jgi:hypothetical protein
MSASDSLSKQLFHGSMASIPVGGVVQDKGNGAWASTSWGEASKYASPSYRTDPSAQPALFNPVYTVEPVDKAETEAHSKERNVPSDVRVSKKGFRVTGIHSWVSK